MELIDKRKIEGKIHDGNWNVIDRNLNFLKNILHQNQMTWLPLWNSRDCSKVPWVEDFHTKALSLVKEAEYLEGDTWNRVLRDTIISGLASYRICAKIIKEGKDVTLPRVMEIAQLEVST